MTYESRGVRVAEEERSHGSGKGKLRVHILNHELTAENRSKAGKAFYSEACYQ